MCKTTKVPRVEQIDRRARWVAWKREWTGKHWLQEGPRPYRQFMKKRKRRLERRKAKRYPEAAPTYGHYKGYD